MSMIGPRGWRLAALAAVVLLAVAGVRPAEAAAGPKFPALSGRVVDDAHMLPAATAADLTTKLAALEAKTSRQLVVATVPSLQGYEIEDYGYQLGRAWGLGQKGLNNGVILLVAPTEHRVRIEVGYGLEGVVTDALSSVILQTQVLPRFKAGDMPGGVVAGADALIDQLSADPSTAEQKLAAASAAAAQPQGAQDAGTGKPSLFAIVFLVIVVVMVVRGMMTGRGLWLLPLFFGGGGGGGGGGFGGGGGGFSGGGGSFGGGGSSGSW